MIPSKNRLKNSQEIQEIFRVGKSTKSGFLFLRFHHNNLQVTRIAFSIGLNYSKSAVKRNRIKRLLRLAAKDLLSDLRPGFDIVVYVKNIKHKDVYFESIVLCLKKSLASAKILK